MSTDVEPRSQHPAQATYDLQKAARQQAFLDAYARCGTIYKAAQAVGISRETVRLWERDDPDFLERFQEAHAEFGDYLQALALQKVERLESKDNILHLAMLNAHVPHLYAPERKQLGPQTVNNTQVIINYPQDYEPRRRFKPEIVDSNPDGLPQPDTEPETDTVTDTGDDGLSVD